VCAALANPSNIRVTDSGLTDYGSGYIGNISDPVSYTGYGVHAYQNLAWDNVPGATYYSFYYSSRSLGSVWGINQARFYRALNTQNYVLPLAINSGSNLTIKACNDVSCSAGASFSSADTVIENPNVITCFDVTNSGFKVRVRSTQGNSAGLAGNPSVLFRNKSAFTNLNSGNSGIRVQIRNMDDSVRGSGYNTGWVNTGTASTYIVNAYNGTANEFLPGDWTVTGLTSNTAYKVCSQTRNSSAVFYRPGPADTQWNCVACATADLTVLGYIRVKTSSGYADLRIISAADALTLGNGILKVARFAGDTNSAAELVSVSSPQASPVRVNTPYGVKSWRKKP
jgi:hypothetical protein